jgi:hypothetical protein
LKQTIENANKAAEIILQKIGKYSEKYGKGNVVGDIIHESAEFYERAASWSEKAGAEGVAVFGLGMMTACEFTIVSKGFDVSGDDVDAAGTFCIDENFLPKPPK